MQKSAWLYPNANGRSAKPCPQLAACKEQPATCTFESTVLKSHRKSAKSWLPSIYEHKEKKKEEKINS